MWSIAFGLIVTRKRRGKLLVYVHVLYCMLLLLLLSLLLLLLQPKLFQGKEVFCEPSVIQSAQILWLRCCYPLYLPPSSSPLSVQEGGLATTSSVQITQSDPTGGNGPDEPSRPGK